MVASYKKLFNLLIDCDMKKKELAEKAAPALPPLQDGQRLCCCVERRSREDLLCIGLHDR